MTTKQFIERMAKIQNYLVKDFHNDIMVRGCQDMQFKIENRVRETGKLSDGSTRNYSTKTTLVGPGSFVTKGAWNEVLSQAKGNDNAGIHWVTINKNGRKYRLIVLPGGYKKVRQLDGLTTSVKNYSRTTEMWRGFGIKKGNKNTVLLGGRNKISQDRINWNSERDGANIIFPTDAEQVRLAKYITDNLTKYMRATLGN